MLAEKKDAALEKKIGVMQDIDEPDETLNSAQLQELVASMLDESKAPTRSLKLDTLGIPDVVSGLGVFVIIPALGISKTFYVDEDMHTFKDNYHRMTVTLNEARDLQKKPAAGGNATSGKTVGSTVYFNGGNHYFTSGSTSPTGGTRKAGKAKLTLIAEGAKHPYHVVGGAYNDVDGDCNVYGWVNADQIS